MRKYITKICAAALCLLLLASALTGCSASRPISSSDEELTAVGSVGGYEVLFEELRYVTMQYRRGLESEYGEGIWDNEQTAAAHRDELYELVTRNLTANYAVLSLCDEVGISIDNETIQDAVKEYMDGLVSEVGGRKNYKASLAEQSLTDHFMRFIVGVDYCQNELFYSYTEDLSLIETDNDKIYEYIMSGGFVRTLHVYIQNDEGDDVALNRAAAGKVHEQLVAGTSITTLIGSNVNEDYDLTTTNGYYFTRGEMVEQYEQAAFALEIGGISDVVETSSGFYVIQRLALDPAYVVLYLTGLIEQYQYAQLNKFIDDKQDSLTFEFNEYGKSLDLTKLK